MFERLRLRPRLAWIRPVSVAVLALVGVLLAPDVMPILPRATLVRAFPNYPQALADRFGWDSLTHTVEQVYAALPPAQRAQAGVLTGNYGEAGALQQLAPPGRLPPVMSGHNNYYLWGPGTCIGQRQDGVQGAGLPTSWGNAQETIKIAAEPPKRVKFRR